MIGKFPVIGLLLIVTACPNNAFSNGYEFDLNQLARIDRKRKVPNFKIIRRPEPSRKVKGWRYETVLLSLGDDRVLRLGEKSISSETPSNPGREVGVIEDSVKAGWLADAEDLLLVAWSDNSGELGTSHSLYRGTMVVRHTVEKTVPLIRNRSLAGASSRHIGYPGLTFHHYDFDAKRDILIDRISQNATVTSQYPKPLHYPMENSEGDVIFTAMIRQLVVRRYKYHDETLKTRSSRFYYQARGRERLREIARFYLGPLAPSSAILEANTNLRSKGNEASGAGIVPPKGTQVRIPVPKQWLDVYYAPDRVTQEKPSAYSEKRDPALLAKIRPLYPDIQLQRGKSGELFFSSVKEVARVRLEDGTERLVLCVRIIVPASMVDHGRGEILIFKDAEDAFPMVRYPMFALPVMRASEIHLINNRWLQFGASSPLVSLVNEDSLKNFSKKGLGLLIYGLTVCAASDALDVYLNGDREAFLKLAPIRKHRQGRVNLPNRISRFEIYPSLVEEMRYSRFRYSDAWEGTLLVRLTPADETRKPLILEIGARASSAGIESDQVELLLWETREEEPKDRPAPRIGLTVPERSNRESKRGFGRHKRVRCKNTVSR